MTTRIFSTRLKYCSTVYVLFINCSIRFDPDWIGRWIELQAFSFSAIAWISFSDMSWGWGVMNRKRIVRSTSLARRIKSAKSNSPSWYELTFCPSSVISLNPRSLNRSTSSTMLCSFRLRSLPRVNGTTQNVQNLSQPRMTEIHAVIPSVRSGIMSS